MTKVIVIGGGWVGCAAAISARKAGAEVTILERTDLLLGLGNVGGLTRNNGRYTAAEESILMGGGELFELTDRYSRHKNIDFPGHRLDTGHAKLMAPYYPLERLRAIRGFENAKFEDPYSAGVANSIRHLSIAPRDNSMKVSGLSNLFTAGEKSGFYIGHTEAIVTGYLAGHIAVREALNMELIELPEQLAIGDFISYSNRRMHEDGGDLLKFTFAGSIYFERMKKENLYITDVKVLQEKIEEAGLLQLYDKNLVN